MKKWILLLLVVCLALSLAACGGEKNIVEDLEGPEGIDLFAGIWYYEARDLWLEIYYDGSWCSFEDGGMLRAFGQVAIDGDLGTLEPTEGEDRFVLTAREGKLTDEEGAILFHVTEVGIRKPLIVNDLGLPDILPEDTKVAGDVARSFAKEYVGFYISEDGIYGLEVFEDGTFELLEYGLLVESGSFLCVTDPDYGEIYSVDTDMLKYRLVIAQEERLYLGECGIFAPGEKSTGSDE